MNLIHIISANTDSVGNLFLEIVEGRVEHRTGQSSRSDRIELSMGSSIGGGGSHSVTGTFGGFVELFKAGHAVKRCGLTCSHVVQPRESNREITRYHSL